MVKKVLTDIYAYWFGETEPKSPEEAKVRMDKWFGGKPETDAEIRDKFGKYLPAAKTTEWDLANLDHREQVGLIILLDQFPRNIHRTDGEAFAYDAKALQIVKELTANGTDSRRFSPVEKIFVHLPFMHSEDVANQDIAVMLYAIEAAYAPPQAIDGARGGLDFATKHRDIIRKFGRFPHRNAMLGRESTPEELEFLKGGRGF